MAFTSPGQINNETARHVYQLARRAADAMVKAGKIAPTEGGTFFAKQVAKGIQRMSLPVSKDIAKAAGLQQTKTAASATTTAVQSIGTGASSLVKTTAGEAAKNTARGTLPVTLAFFAAETAHTVYKYQRGDIDRAEALRRTAESGASNGGALVGAATGAAFGSVVPVIGTAVGAAVGGIGGAILSKLAMKRTIRHSPKPGPAQSTI